MNIQPDEQVLRPTRCVFVYPAKNRLVVQHKSKLASAGPKAVLASELWRVFVNTRNTSTTQFGWLIDPVEDVFSIQ